MTLTASVRGNEPLTVRILGVIGFYGIFFLLIPAVVWAKISEFPDTEILYSPASPVLGIGMLLSIGVALLVGWASYRSTRSKSEDRAFVFSTLLGFLWFSCGAYFSYSADIYAKVRMFFPEDGRATVSGYAQIQRAYHDEGGRRTPPSWNIQTSPVFLNLNIAEADFRWMLDRAPPGMVKDGLTEISSHSHFCARLLFQSAPGALRILNAGESTLPEGSIVKCPSPSETFFLGESIPS